MIQKSFKNEKPALYLIATPIGNLDDITYRAVKTLNMVDVVFAEDTRVAKQLLDNFNIKKPLVASHKFNEKEVSSKLLKYLDSGKNIGLITDRGTPLISDPGYINVVEVIKHGYNVIAIPGATAFVSALITSGFDTNHFYFYGFLSSKENEKRDELLMLTNVCQPIIIYESPHRLNKTLNLINEYFGNINISICREITKLNEEIFRGPIDEAIDLYKEVKGEIVIIIDKHVKKEENEDEIVVKEIKDLVRLGISKSIAIKEVCKKRNISKNRIYNLLINEGEE